MTDIGPAKTAQPGDTHINLTELSLTPEARAAMYPTSDGVPEPRPVPTLAERLGFPGLCGHTPEQHRQLDGDRADAASHDRAMRELTAELERTRDERDERLTLAESSRLAKRLDAMTEAARDHRKTASDALAEKYAALGEAKRARDELTSTQQVATFRQGVINRHRAELGAAGEVIAVVRDAVEQVERALARYDTQPEAAPVEHDGEQPEASLGSPSPRAQDDTTHPLGKLIRAASAVYHARDTVLPRREALADLAAVADELGAHGGAEWMNRRALISDTLRKHLAWPAHIGGGVPAADRVAEAILAALGDVAQPEG